MAKRAGRPRRFLKLAAGAAVGAAALPDPIGRALALPARRGHRHDRGSRACGDLHAGEPLVRPLFRDPARGARLLPIRRPLILPGGASVFHQPKAPGSAEAVTPFHLDSATTRAQSHVQPGPQLEGQPRDVEAARRLDSGQDRLHHGLLHPRGHPLLLRPGRRLHHLRRLSLLDLRPDQSQPDVPVHRHQRPGGRQRRPQVVANPPDEPNETADPANDAKAFKAYGWPTYAERLQAAGVSWRVYQEFDNYGDNALAYFADFRGLDPTSPLYQRGPRLGRGLQRRQRQDLERRASGRGLRQGRGRRHPAPGLLDRRPLQAVRTSRRPRRRPART